MAGAFAGPKGLSPNIWRQQEKTRDRWQYAKVVEPTWKILLRKNGNLQVYRGETWKTCLKPPPSNMITLTLVKFVEMMSVVLTLQRGFIQMICFTVSHLMLANDVNYQTWLVELFPQRPLVRKLPFAVFGRWFVPDAVVSYFKLGSGDLEFWDFHTLFGFQRKGWFRISPAISKTTQIHKWSTTYFT